MFSSDFNSESEYCNVQSHVFACTMRQTDRFSDPALGLEDMAGTLKCVKIIVYRKTLVELMMENNPKARWSCVMTLASVRVKQGPIMSVISIQKVFSIQYPSGAF